MYLKMFLTTFSQFSLLLLFLQPFNGLAECPPDNPNDAIEYDFISENEYDRNYTSISSIDKRPLGFAKSTWYFNQPNQSNPCIRVSGAQNRRIEILFETHPNARLCVKSPGAQTECSDAGTGTFSSCPLARSDVMYFEFLCNQGEEYDVRFWYRFTLGDLPADDPEDHWCENRGDMVEYPESLKRLPDNFPLEDKTTKAPNGARLVTPGFVGVTGLICLLINYLFIV